MRFNSISQDFLINDQNIKIFGIVRHENSLAELPKKGMDGLAPRAKPHVDIRPRTGAPGSVLPTLVPPNTRAYKRLGSPATARGCGSPRTQHVWPQDPGLGSLVVPGVWGNRVGKQLRWCAASTRNPGAWR